MYVSEKHQCIHKLFNYIFSRWAHLGLDWIRQYRQDGGNDLPNRKPPLGQLSLSPSEWAEPPASSWPLLPLPRAPGCWAAPLSTNVRDLHIGRGLRAASSQSSYRRENSSPGDSDLPTVTQTWPGALTLGSVPFLSPTLKNKQTCKPYRMSAEGRTSIHRNSSLTHYQESFSSSLRLWSMYTRLGLLLTCSQSVCIHPAGAFLLKHSRLLYSIHNCCLMAR